MIGAWGNQTLASITSSSGTPTSLIAYPVYSGNNIYAYILTNTSAGNITITFNQAANGKQWISVIEYGNIVAAPVDAVASGTNTLYGSTISTGTLTTTFASEMLWTMCYSPGGTPAIGTAPISWTGIAAYGTSLLVEDGVTGLAGNYVGQCTLTGSGTSAIAVALK